MIQGGPLVRAKSDALELRATRAARNGEQIDVLSDRIERLGQEIQVGVKADETARRLTRWRACATVGITVATTPIVWKKSPNTLYVAANLVCRWQVKRLATVRWGQLVTLALPEARTAWDKSSSEADRRRGDSLRSSPAMFNGRGPRYPKTVTGPDAPTRTSAASRARLAFPLLVGRFDLKLSKSASQQRDEIRIALRRLVGLYRRRRRLPDMGGLISRGKAR
jgi:hypothetical protein